MLSEVLSLKEDHSTGGAARTHRTAPLSVAW
jgi:hypothetical protein